VKLLCLHADKFSYRFDHPTTPAADDHAPGETADYDDALVVFVAIEEGDEHKIAHAAKEVRKVAREARVSRIVVNPFVHLTADPAAPEEARVDSSHLADRLKETFDGEVDYTSFGWYKAFRINVRGDDASMFFRHV
jgi:threonyl-tRNA synthetase